MSSQFIFTTCQAGAEAALKAEMARLKPDYKFAFSRPGFVTFKLPDGLALSPDFALESTFARAYGLSSSKAKGLALKERVACVRELQQKLAAKAIHVWAREKVENSNSLVDEAVGALTREFGKGASPDSAELKALSFARVVKVGAAAKADQGSLVLDVVIVEPNEWWLGSHVQSPERHRPWAGGVYDQPLPEGAPSRAYLKLEEGLAWSGLQLKAGHRAIEFGVAPGGAAYGLLQRGLDVIGVDPADVAPSIASHPKFKHHRCQAGQVVTEDTGQIDWIFSDMNLPPEDVLKVLRKHMPVWSKTARVRGGLITVKFRDWNAANDLPKIVEEFKALGFSRARTAHLTHNRQEVCLALEV